MASGSNPIAYKTIVEPWITEAATEMAALNKYVFKVFNEVGKNQIKLAVEELYKVKAVSVRTINVPGKKRARGRIVGRKAGYKKAIVTLKEGDSIDIFGNK
ncbi:MAG: large subunit ribosomal protein [Patescibacteria group bacterium]|nr:large subunit ribosomal protein [Patescibacteria group bacterium]